jgi:hypothetical protein
MLLLCDFVSHLTIPQRLLPVQLRSIAVFKCAHACRGSKPSPPLSPSSKASQFGIRFFCASCKTAISDRCFWTSYLHRFECSESITGAFGTFYFCIHIWGLQVCMFMYIQICIFMHTDTEHWMMATACKICGIQYHSMRNIFFPYRFDLQRPN